MLFHVTATHAPQDCPAYNLEKMPDLVAAMEKAEATAKELKVKVHFLMNGAPEHVTYLLLEADSPATIARFTSTFPLRQDFKVTPVVPFQETVVMARQLMAQRR